MSNGYFVENSACVANNYNYLFGFPPAGASVDTLTFGTAATTSIIQTINCKACTKPLIQLSEATLAQTITNVKFSNMNDQIKTGA